MKRQIRILCFYFKQFISVPYFVQLMCFTTVSATLIQYFAFTAWGGITPLQGWIRAGVIGMWTTTTSAAGIIGFERHKGTLVYLVSAPLDARRILGALVASASVFGLVSFPIAWLTWSVLSLSVSDISLLAMVKTVPYICALFVGCLALSFVIAAVFVLTPNAIAYEGLVLLPVLILSGVVTTSANDIFPILHAVILPISLPVKYLLTSPELTALSLIDFSLWAAALIFWFAVANFCIQQALRKAREHATLQVV